MSNPRLNRNPLEQVRAFVPVEDTARLHWLAEGRGVTVNTLIREAIKTYLEKAQ